MLSKLTEGCDESAEIVLSDSKGPSIEDLSNARPFIAEIPRPMSGAGTGGNHHFDFTNNYCSKDKARKKALPFNVSDDDLQKTHCKLYFLVTIDTVHTCRRYKSVLFLWGGGGGAEDTYVHV